MLFFCYLFFFGNFDPGHRTLRGLVNFQFSLTEKAEPGAHIIGSHALIGLLGLKPGLLPVPVILNFDHDISLLSPGYDPDLLSFLTHAHAVLDGIFHQWLQSQRREHKVRHLQFLLHFKMTGRQDLSQLDIHIHICCNEL